MNHSVIPIQERSDIFSSDTTTKGNHRWFLLHYLVISYARSIAILRGVVVPASGSPDDGSPCLVVTASSYTFPTPSGSNSGFSSASILVSQHQHGRASLVGDLIFTS